MQLHGNASFEGKYLTRATRKAKQKGAGLVMMHSHPATGWQDLSEPDILAERDIVAYQAQSTKHPFLGMTIGKDGYWSARFWTPHFDQMKLEWCDKVRVPLQERYQIDWHPSVLGSAPQNQCYNEQSNLGELAFNITFKNFVSESSVPGAWELLLLKR